MNIAPAQSRGPALLKNGVKAIHEAFADYILMNPQCTLREMGAHFGYSPAWICTVTNSDMFKAYFEGRRQGINATIAGDLPSKLAAAAHIATERMIEVVSTTNDNDTLIDAFDKILQRHGYAPTKQAPQQQNNVFFLNSGDLAAAREKLVNAHAPIAAEQPLVTLTAEEVALASTPAPA